MHHLQLLNNTLNFIDEKFVVFLIWLNIILLAVIIIYFTVRVIRPWVSKYLAITREENKIPTELPENKNIAEDNADKAAIAAALYFYFNEMHDEESDIITVKRVSKTYSPWSSKLYSMRNLR